MCAGFHPELAGGGLYSSAALRMKIPVREGITSMRFRASKTRSYMGLIDKSCPRRRTLGYILQGFDRGCVVVILHGLDARTRTSWDAVQAKTQLGAHRRFTSELATTTTPLEPISSIRSSLRSHSTPSHFQATLDYNHIAGALNHSSNNTPLRAFECAQKDLLDQLDDIESVGD
ncbi:hypothetical protein PENSPDRAFT_689450 [Peniophora sp. CONT]|nr:hypothetical protein PENSPDRAFT_689450 [Peniophora sp. CONT]